MTDFQRYAVAAIGTALCLAVAYLGYRAGHPTLVWIVDMVRG